MDASILTAPTSTDNNTVILWVVTVLVAVVALLSRTFWKKMESNESRCREENEQARREAKEAIRQVHVMQGGVIMEQTKTQLATNAMNEKVCTILEKLCDRVERRRDDDRHTPVPHDHRNDESDTDLREKAHKLRVRQ